MKPSGCHATHQSVSDPVLMKSGFLIRKRNTLPHFPPQLLSSTFYINAGYRLDGEGTWTSKVSAPKKKIHKETAKRTDAADANLKPRLGSLWAPCLEPPLCFNQERRLWFDCTMGPHVGQRWTTPKLPHKWGNDSRCFLRKTNGACVFVIT